MKRMLIALLICGALTIAPAMAGPQVSARLEGSTLYITWQASGACELTVYQDGWPLCVRQVNGSDGGAEISVGDPEGNYSVRLKTPSGYLNAGASREAEAPAELPEFELTYDDPAPSAVSNRDDLASQIVALTNQERAKAGLSPLRLDGELTRAACVRAGEITQRFSHTRPDGSSWSTVSASAYAENIARGQRTAEKAIAAWMTSSTGHRESILRKSYGSIGVCAYSHNGVMYWVQLFGR